MDRWQLALLGAQGLCPSSVPVSMLSPQPRPPLFPILSLFCFFSYPLLLSPDKTSLEKPPLFATHYVPPSFPLLLLGSLTLPQPVAD